MSVNQTIVPEIVTVPLSYLEYYHNESKQNPFYSTPEKIAQQEEILAQLRKKGGAGEDKEVALKKSELEVFRLNS